MNKNTKKHSLAIHFQNTSWTPFVTRNMSFWHSCLDRAGWQKNAHEYRLPNRHTISITVDSGKLTTVFNSAELNYAHDRAIHALCQSKEFFTVVKIIQRHGNRLIAAARILESRATEKNYQHFIQVYQAMCPSLSLITSIGRAGHEALLREIRRAYPAIKKSEIELLTALLSYPNNHTPMAQCQMSLLTMGAHIQGKKIRNWITSPEVQKQIRKHLKRFSFLPVNFNEQPWTLSEVRMHLRDSLKKNCRSELDRIITGHRKKLRERNAILKGVEHPRLKHIATVMQMATEVNESRKQVFCRASLAYRALFSKLAKKYKLPSWQTMYQFTPHEIERLAFHNERAILSILPKRRVVGIVSEPKNEPYYRIMDGAIVQHCVRVLHQKTSMIRRIESSVLRGYPANSGIARGTVKIVKKKSDFNKFQTGNILVSPMTSVDFVPIMEKAAAFVTDEGGITSHASIVSRELNKPCIIGTKIATRVFKNGDRVEVDATKGIVKKL